MKKILLSVAVLLLSVTGLSAFTAGPARAFDSDSAKSAACAGINDTFGSSSCSTDGKAATKKTNDLITTIVNILTVVVGIVAVIMVIIGGFRFIVSSGDSTSVSGAKKTVIYALIGLIIVVLAQVIVRFVLNTSVATPAKTTSSSQKAP